MSRKRSNWNDLLNTEIMEEVHAEGYDVRKFTEYHVRLFCDDSENQIDLWAGSGKCMQVGAHSSHTFKTWGELKKFISEVFSN